MSKLIERDAAVEVLNQLVRERFSLSDGFQFYIDALKDVELNVMALPTVDAVPVVHGRWKRNKNGTYSCSKCQSWIPNEQKHYANFCLYCGAKMDEKDGERHG